MANGIRNIDVYVATLRDMYTNPQVKMREGSVELVDYLLSGDTVANISSLLLIVEWLFLNHPKLESQMSAKVFADRILRKIGK